MTIFLSGLVIFLSRTIEAITGFGGTVIALPFMAMIIGMQEGVILLTIICALYSFYVVITKFRYIDFKQFLIIGSFLLLGLPIGMYLFRLENILILKKILAVVIIITSSIQVYKILAKKKKKNDTNNISKIYYIILFFSGIVHGMFSCGGTLVVYYASKVLKDKAIFRSTLCLLWATLNSILIVGYLFDPSMHMQLASVSIKTIWMIPFFIAGICTGEWVHKKIQGESFSLVVFSLLIVTGIFMIIF